MSSQVVDAPTGPPFGSPQDPFRPNGCRFRLGAFWSPGGDYWWYVADQPSPLSELVRGLLARPAIDVEKQMPRIRAVVEDAVGRVKEHALPYFARVAQWAGHAP